MRGILNLRAARGTLYTSIVAGAFPLKNGKPALDMDIEVFRPMSAIPASNPATNPGLSDLIQELTDSGSTALASTLSSPTVQSAIEQASPVDLVQLSDEALQLQVVGSLFGTSNNQAGNDTNTLFDFLDPGLAAASAANSFPELGTQSGDTTDTNALLGFLDPALAGTTATAANSSSSGLTQTASTAFSENNAQLLSSLFNLQA